MKFLHLKGRWSKTAVGVIVATVFLAVPALSEDRFELLDTRELTVPGKALDLAVSPDGRWTFVLTSAGEVAVYDNSGRVIQMLGTGSGYEQLVYDSGGNKLVLVGPGKELKVLSLVMRFDIDSKSSPYRGTKGAPVTITVFSEFQCPYCAQLVPVLEQVMDKYQGKVMLVFKNYPLRRHRMARPAATAAMAANKQGHFWKYHDRIFENYRNISEEFLLTTARELGLDMKRFEEDRKSVDINNIINRDTQEASRIGVRGTPSVFINGKRLDQRSLEAFSTAIEKEIETARKS
jgi:predicted DsbA family dithiol-disulfide isomerase